MTKPIKSKHDLTRCTACRAHIRAADRPSTTDCPFCGANLHTGRALSPLPSGRGALLAASLLAFSASACGAGQTDAANEPTPLTEPSAPGAEPSEPSADQGQEAVDEYDPHAPDDNAVLAEYGISPPFEE